MIRPSSLNIAKRCSLAPVLSEKFGTSNDATERGLAVDAQVMCLLRGDVIGAPDPDAKACFEWIRKNYQDWHMLLQQRLVVRDPESGAILTQGTADVVCHRGDEVVVIDLKKREQYFAGKLAEINEDLQTHAYALGAVALTQAFCYRKLYLLFGDGQVEPKESITFGPNDFPAIYDQLREIQLAKVRATRGSHCLNCYAREHCPAWMLPAHEGPTALEPFTKPGGLTAENAPVALETVKALREAVELAEERLKAWARANGGIVHGDRKWAPVLMPPRRSANVAALEAAGLTDYINQGAPFEQFRWLRAAKD